jgi:hypothetical protein
MTRINIGIPPKKLTDSHLLAEHREIIRVCTLYKDRLDKGKLRDLPTQFVLGEGHVMYFLDKGYYTYKRYNELYEECLRRKFEVLNYHRNWSVYLLSHWNDLTPGENDVRIITERIIERLSNSTQQPRYYSQDITIQESINLLK